jgi:hypothetical protein
MPDAADSADRLDCRARSRAAPGGHDPGQENAPAEHARPMMCRAAVYEASYAGPGLGLLRARRWRRFESAPNRGNEPPLPLCWAPCQPIYQLG